MGIEHRERYRTDKRGRRKKVGDSYQVRYRGKNLGTYHRKGDAESVLIQAKAEFKTTGRVKTFKEIQLDELVTRHLTALKGKRLKKGTIAGYTNYLGHLKGFLGKDRRVSTISHEDLELFVAYLSDDKDMAPRTVNVIIQCVGQMFDAAVRWGYLSENAARQVTNRPKRRGLREVQVLNVDEHKRLVEATHPHYQLMIEVWPFLAVRPSEMFGLKVVDYDVDKRTLRVERQYKQSTYTGLKHDARPRTLHLDDRTMGLLDRQIERLGGRAEADLPLFQSETGKAVNLSYFYRAIFTKAVEKAKLSSDVTPHTLRHCGATWLLEAGVSLMFTAKHLGHSDPSVTASTYSHLLDDVDKTALSRLGRWYEGMSEIYEAVKPKPIGNIGDVESETGSQPLEIEYTDEFLEQVSADADRFMEELRQERVDEIIRLAKAQEFGKLRYSVEELRANFSKSDVDDILARASESGVAVGRDAKMTHIAG